jgi:citrate lyase subunit beta/citryl-CoA lyase
LDIVALRALTEGVRSKLFVPGSRPELFPKAAAGQADALSFDLEDSVVQARKVEARQAVAQFLSSTGVGSKISIVRVNSLASGLFADDIAAVVVPGLHLINLPKVEGRDDILTTIEHLERAEKLSSRAQPVGILANIETPKGLRVPYEIATAHPRVVGLQIGFVDLSLACGIDQNNVTALNAVRLAVRLAASEAGIAAFDGAYADVKDLEGFRTAAEQSRALGITGKSCVHPTQIAVANEVFAPSPDAVEQALAITHAADEAEAEGTGAFLLDGKMIDAPIVERARRVVANARRYGIPLGENGE